MHHIGPFIIARATEIEQQLAETIAAGVELTRLTARRDAIHAFIVNADLQAACQAADAYLHRRYGALDDEQAALCNQIVDACAAAYAFEADALDTHLAPEARARIKARIDALLALD